MTFGDRHRRGAAQGARSAFPKNAPLSRVEARLNDLEQKLDQILEALKTRKP